MVQETDRPTATPTPTRTATPRPPASISVVDASFEESASAGENATVSATIHNAGGRVGNYTAELTVDGQPVATRSVSLAPNAYRSLEFQPAFEFPGEFEIGLSGSSLGTLTVGTDGAVRADGAIRVLDASIPASWVKAGFNTTVQATVENTLGSRATTDLVVTVGGDRVATESVTLGPDERTAVAIGFPATSGQVAVDGVSAGRLNVSNVWGDGAAVLTEDSSSPRPGPDVGLVVLLFLSVVLAGGAASVIRRRR